MAHSPSSARFIPNPTPCGRSRREFLWQVGGGFAGLALIVPNHHQAPLAGEDAQTFEQDLPGANTAGFNTRTIGGLPLETSLTMNDSWGFNLTDHNYKSVRELIHYLVKAAGQGANLLLNIGPRPDGTIPPEAAERLHELGDWLARYGGSIYGTRAGPITPRKTRTIGSCGACPIDGSKSRRSATRCWP